jgi:flagellar motor component MotA
MTDEERKKIVHEIRIGHVGLLKLREGQEPSSREEQALKFLEPIDVTAILIDEIDSLNEKLVRVTFENSLLKNDQ